jgi:hypothetical protein
VKVVAVGDIVGDVKRWYWQFFEWPAVVPGDSATADA